MKNPIGSLTGDWLSTADTVTFNALRCKRCCFKLVLSKSQASSCSNWGSSLCSTGSVDKTSLLNLASHTK